MLKKTIRYTDYDGNPQETTAYFDLTRDECINLSFQYEADGGLVGRLKKMIASRDENEEIPQKMAVDFVRMLIDNAYGVRPKDDPSLFLKEDDDGKPLIRRFKQSLAYHTYVAALLSGEESLEEFASNVMPKVSEEQLSAAKKQLTEDGGVPEAALREVR